MVLLIQKYRLPIFITVHFQWIFIVLLYVCLFHNQYFKIDSMSGTIKWNRWNTKKKITRTLTSMMYDFWLILVLTSGRRGWNTTWSVCRSAALTFPHIPILTMNTRGTTPLSPTFLLPLKTTSTRFVWNAALRFCVHVEVRIYEHPSGIQIYLLWMVKPRSPTPRCPINLVQATVFWLLLLFARYLSVIYLK